MDVCEITETKKSREWKIRWVMVGVQTGIKLVSYSVWGSDGQHQRYQDGQVKETPAVHLRPLPGHNSPFQHQGMPSYGDSPPELRAGGPAGERPGRGLQPCWSPGHTALMPFHFCCPDWNINLQGQQLFSSHFFFISSFLFYLYTPNLTQWWHTANTRSTR